MRDFSISIKQAIQTALGSTFTIDSQTVNVYTDTPKEPSTYYIGQELLSANDIGTKDKFISDVMWLISCYVKVNLAEQSSVFLDKISNHVTTTLINRGQGIADPSSNFSFYSIQLETISETNKYLENKVLMVKNIRINLKAQQIN